MKVPAAIADLLCVLKVPAPLSWYPSPFIDFARAGQTPDSLGFTKETRTDYERVVGVEPVGHLPSKHTEKNEHRYAKPSLRLDQKRAYI